MHVKPELLRLGRVKHFNLCKFLIQRLGYLVNLHTRGCVSFRVFIELNCSVTYD